MDAAAGCVVMATDCVVVVAGCVVPQFGFAFDTSAALPAKQERSTRDSKKRGSFALDQGHSSARPTLNACRREAGLTLREPPCTRVISELIVRVPWARLPRDGVKCRADRVATRDTRDTRTCCVERVASRLREGR